MATYYTDSIVFTVKRSVGEARLDIARLEQAFPQEPAFKFKEHELAYFEKLHALLTPKAKARRHMAAALDYLQNHLCKNASQAVVKPKAFEFKFNWESD